MDPHADDDVEKGSPRQTDKDLPPDPRFEQRTERESRIIVEEPEDINAPSTGVPEPINTQFQEQVQELQRELSDFLAQHVAKTLNLQNSIHNEPLKLRKHSSGVMHGGDNFSVASPPSTGNMAVYHHDSRLSRLELASTRPTALDMHNDALARFLSMHMSNLQALQNSLLRTHGKSATLMSIDGRAGGGVGVGDGSQNGSGTMHEYANLVATAALEAIFIVAVLAFTHSIIGPQRHRIPFSVAMLFSLFSLSFLLLCLCLSLWGFVAASWRRLKHEPESQVQVNFYLFLGRQLQFCAVSSFVLPVIILTFYIFTGIAFPIVHLVFLLVASLVVLGSVVYRVPISLENVSSIVLSTRHMERPSLRPVTWNIGRRRSIY